MVNVSSFIINMAGCPENLTLFLAFFHFSLYPVQSRTETNFLYICISKAILVNDHQNLFMAFISLSVVLLHVAISFSLQGLVQCCFLLTKGIYLSTYLIYLHRRQLHSWSCPVCRRCPALCSPLIRRCSSIETSFCGQFILMSYQSFLFSVLFF